MKYYFYLWRDEGIDQTIHDLLRWQVREMGRRKADPSLAVLDTQSVHAAAEVPAESTGCELVGKCSRADSGSRMPLASLPCHPKGAVPEPSFVSSWRCSA